MKLVARKDFANVPALGLKLNEKTEGFIHENHVHKGHRFEVGSTDIFDDLKETEKVIVAQLMVSKSAVINNDSNKHVIAKIDAEAKIERAAEKSASEKAATSLPELIAAAVATALASVGVIKPAKT